jgi:DNA-binding MarR family transcriptional regulator
MMSQYKAEDDETKEAARRINTMINDLSLFTRKTMLVWLPELESQMGITSERFMVMFELNMEPDRSLKELAQSLVISPSSLSVMINSMVEQGVVTRLTDAADRRRVVLRLSEKGDALFRMADDQLAEKFAGYLAQLPAKDKDDLNHATTMMLNVMDRLLKRSVSGKGKPQE